MRLKQLSPACTSFGRLNCPIPRAFRNTISFYGMVILNSRDSFVEEAGNMDGLRPVGPTAIPRPRLNNRQCISKLAFSSEIIGDAQLWLETGIMWPEIIMSDALRDEIKQRDLVMPRLDKVKVV